MKTSINLFSLTILALTALATPVSALAEAPAMEPLLDEHVFQASPKVVIQDLGDIRGGAPFRGLNTPETGALNSNPANTAAAIGASAGAGVAKGVTSASSHGSSTPIDALFGKSSTGRTSYY